MEFSRQECWSGLPFLPQGILPIQGSNLGSCIAGRLFTAELPKKPLRHTECNQNNFYLLITLSVFWAFCWFINVSIRPQFSSVQFSRSVVSDSLRPYESQHTRPPCPSPTPGVHSNSRPTSRWYHPAISSSVVPFSSCPQSLPASESCPMSQLFAWDGQSTGVSALA